MQVSVSSLPIEVHLPAILGAVREQSLVVLQAQPGSGKTTRVPVALAGEASGQVWVLEPRRLAATLAAQHVAELEGEACGQTIGYRVRHDVSISKNTKVLFLTEGMFLRLLYSNPTLKGVSHLVIDEFHERHLETDVAFALARFLQIGKRPDLKVVVMSATLDIEAFRAAVPGTTVFDIAGKVFPVATSYLPRLGEESIVDSAVRGVLTLAKAQSSGNILAFLPGTGDILRVCERLKIPDLRDWGVFALTASLQHQTRAHIFSRDGRRKVIVATNVAESSVTLPDITGVVDTGVGKIPGHASWSGLPTLELKKVAKSSCIQRQGRAGRTVSGTCIRMYSEADYLQRDDYLSAEIERLDLSSIVLQLAQLGELWGIADIRDPGVWPWLSAPRAELWEQAVALLVELGAIELGRITAKGRAMSRWPFHPRLAVIIEEGIGRGQGFAALAAACLLNEQGMSINSDSRPRDIDCDVASQLQTWAAGNAHRFFDRGARERFERDLRSLLPQLPSGQQSDKRISNLEVPLMAGFFDRVARKRPTTDANQGRSIGVTYNFCLGRGGRLSPRSRVRPEEFLLCLVAAEDPSSSSAATGTLIHLASAISRDVLLASNSPLLKEATDYQWHERGQRVDAVARTLYGQLVLREIKLDRSAGASDLLKTMLIQKWPKPFPNDDALNRYNCKVELLQSVGLAKDFPVFKGDMFGLLAEVICDGKRSFAEIQSRTLDDYIYEQLSFAQVDFIDHYVPNEIRLGNGKVLPLRYGHGGEVWVSGFVQDFYGITDVLMVADGRVVVKAELLGPHRRPVQVTGHLGAFWSLGYPALAKELRGRYPRHHWPEDPNHAPAVLTKSRLDKENG